MPVQARPPPPAMLLQRCTQLVSLRAFRPLVGAWDCAFALHTLPRSDQDNFGQAESAAAQLQAGGGTAADELPWAGVGDPDSLEAAAAAAAERQQWGGMEAEAAVPVEQQRLLQAGVLGVPNAGKSTLVNALVGMKVRCAAGRCGQWVFGLVGE